VIKETNANTGNITDYLYGDDLIKQTQAANDRYYLYDGLGSTRALSDSTGTITDTYNYESFGSLLNQTGSTENDYLFTGEQYDSGLDNYYLRARYYDQNVGRFTQMDTWMGNNQDPVTLHKYLYANVDPVNNIDPSGNFSLSSISTGINIAGILNTIATPPVSTISTQSSVETGHAREYDTTASNYHFYEMETTICITLNAACTVDKVFEELRRFPAPGWDSSKLVNSGDRTTIKFLGFSGGGVVHTVNSPEVRNTTLPGHIFEEGYVDRIVRQKGSQIKIITVGEGINRSLARKFLNLITYGPAFSHLDRQIKGNIATQ
jgi:RHS repeat-associated protein